MAAIAIYTNLQFIYLQESYISHDEGVYINAAVPLRTGFIRKW